MKGCIEFKGSIGKDGYGYLNVRGTEKTHVAKRRWRIMLAHRYAWQKVNGQIPEGLCVLHRCDNPPCINVSHLFLGTQADNMKDKVAKGRHNTKRKTQC